MLQRQNSVTEFFKKKEFLKLQKEWKDKLKQSDFVDIEEASERLKYPDKRTIAFNNRDMIASFYSELGHMIETRDIPAKDKNILELYCQGTYVVRIAQSMMMSRHAVHRIIKKYKKEFIR